MDLRLSEVQEAVRDGVGRFLAKASSPERVRAAEPLGWDRAVWDGLAAMGVPAMGVVPELGGQGAALADLAVVAGKAGAHLASAPVVESMVAARLLAGQAGSARLWLDHLVDGKGPVTIALRPARGGRLTLVPGGAVADAVVALDGDELVAISLADGCRVAPANLGSAPLADIDLGDQGSDQRTVVAVGGDAHRAMVTALDEWRALTAAWLVGLARSAFGIGVGYVKERRQFGVPIGSFQAVQHRLADLATAVEGANLLADKAAWALDADDASAATLPAMAYSFCGETAQGVTSAVLHLHGGYGFMEEYDIQLYFRRAKATRLVLADPRRELQHLAGRLFGPTEPT
jgi:alkylation response protein AidB-like acyl-CoA dehydrogenase